MHPLRRAAVLLAAAGLCAGCASSGPGSGGWTQGSQPTDEPNPVQIQPVLPGQAGGGGGPGSGGAPGSGTGAPPSSGSSHPKSDTDPNVVAKHLSYPVGLVMLPDGSALVGERTTGRILDVQPHPNLPTPTVKTLTGLDPSGDGGLLDLALSPHYAEDQLVYAYITTPTDNRVVEFTLKGPVTPVLTGIPKGRTGNGGRIAFAPNGDLYVATGDAGHPSLAQNPTSLAGKILRITDIGSPAPGNPTPGSPVLARGFQGPGGLCVVPDTGQVLEVEATPTGPGEINVITPGSDYGYPVAAASDKKPAGALPSNAAGPGGCGVQGTTLFIASLDGAQLVGTPLTGKGSAVKPGAFRTATKKYGRLRTVVVAADGALWLTTSNKDGHGKPTTDDERVIRLELGGQGGNNPG